MWRAYRHSLEAWSPKESLLGHDRRIFHRVERSFECRLNSRLYGLESGGRTINLSLGGMNVVAPVEWPEGSRLRVTIASADFGADAIICFRVPFDKESRYGLKFQNAGLRELITLRRILRETYQESLLVRF